MLGEMTMKRIVFVLIFIGLALAGCRSADPSHKDAFILVTRIAINHLELEKNLASEECEEHGTVPEECEDAIDYERWAETLKTFEGRLEEADELIIGVEEIDLLIDAIIVQMDYDTDPRIMAYIKDIKIVLQMMLRELD
jgi:hypothetical protein